MNFCEYSQIREVFYGNALQGFTHLKSYNKYKGGGGILTESVVFSSFNSIIKTLIGRVTFGRHFQLGLIGCI